MKNLLQYILKGIFLAMGCLTAHITSFALHPDTAYISNPDSLQAGIRWADYTVSTTDHHEIAVRKIEPMVSNEHNRTCIIICGGDKGNLSYYTLHAAALSFAGYQVVQFDYRGFGRSTAVALDEEYLYDDAFGRDLEAVVAWTVARYQPSKTGLLAFSMGTIIAQQYLLEHKMDFAVMEGLVINPVIVSRRIQQKDKDKIVKVPESGYDFERKLKKIKTPVLVFAGDEDEVTTVADAARFCKKRKSRRQLITFPGGHMMGMKMMTRNSFGDDYVHKITAFLRG